MSVGCAQIEAGRARHVLVVGADFMARITDPDDRATAAVFADGAGAALLTATDSPGRIGPIILGADGGGAEHIFVERGDNVVRMRGHETFKEAVAWLSRSTLEAVEAAGLGLDDIDLFVYHQANGRILAAVGERLGLPADRVVDCIAQYGNTSAATLPLALDYSAREGRLRSGDRVLLGAFGAGFTWGATAVQWGVA
jgi:3-oxoacyl-[acyl-carrier-protein] synthase-3